MPAALTFFKYERTIQVDAPQTEVTIQDLLNQIRDYEAELINLDYGHIANAYGKQPLGGGAYVGITLELINNWRIAFEARPGPETVVCTVSGGNLVAINDYNNNPIKPTAFTQVVIAQSSSPTIIKADTDYGMLFLLESLRGKGGSGNIGNIFYWNPTSGSDANDGTTPTKAVASFSKAQSLATDGGHDVIFALATTSSGVVTVSETINITVPTLKLRGPGYNFQLIPSSSGNDTVTISADSVELSGFYIKTAAGGTDNGIKIYSASGSVDNVLIKNCWINNTTGNGIDIVNASRTVIETCAIEDCGSNGINMGDNTALTKVSTCIISGSGEDGVNIEGSGIHDNIFENNLIYNNSGYGIDIGSGVLRTGVRLHHTFSGNGSGATRDLGTGTFIETQAGGASPSEIADAVWDEVIAGHLTAGTAGRMLRDAKTKATLASLR